MPVFPASETTDVRGALKLDAATSVSTRVGLFPRNSILEDSLASHAVRLDDLRVWDNLASLLPGTAAADDLAIIGGTFGTDAPTVQSSDGKATTITQYLRFQYVVPSDYIAGQDVQVRLAAGMITTISDDTATIDVQAYAHDGAGSVGADLCTTTAQSINSLVNGEKDFIITAATLVAGATLDVRVTIAITDAATGTAVIGELSKIEMLLDIR